MFWVTGGLTGLEPRAASGTGASVQTICRRGHPAATKPHRAVQHIRGLVGHVSRNPVRRSAAAAASLHRRQALMPKRALPDGAASGYEADADSDSLSGSEGGGGSGGHHTAVSPDAGGGDAVTDQQSYAETSGAEMADRLNQGALVRSDTASAEACIGRSAEGLDTSEATPEEAAKQLKRAADLLTMVHLMVPADVAIYNPALVLWKAISDVPARLRPRLLDMISAADIERLWRTSERRYIAAPAAARDALGADYSQWHDFPEEPGQVATFEGRAAVVADRLTAPLRLNRFRKQFFLHPETDELMGRVDVGKGALGNLLYPLYFSTVGSSIIPTTAEVADIQLEYLPPDALALTEADLPDASWPRPAAPRWPFHGQLSDYMRAVGPGV